MKLLLDVNELKGMKKKGIAPESSKVQLKAKVFAEDARKGKEEEEKLRVATLCKMVGRETRMIIKLFYRE